MDIIKFIGIIFLCFIAITVFWAIVAGVLKVGEKAITASGIMAPKEKK